MHGDYRDGLHQQPESKRAGGGNSTQGLPLVRPAMAQHLVASGLVWPLRAIPMSLAAFSPWWRDELESLRTEAVLGALVDERERYNRLLAAFDAVVRSEARYEEALRTIGANNQDGVGRFARSVIEKGST